MTLRRWTHGMAIVGVALLAASFVWPVRLVPWTSGQQEALRAAQVRVQRLAHPPADAAQDSRAVAERAAELDTAKAEWQRLDADLEAARRGNRRVPQFLFWAGLAIAVTALFLARAHL